MSDIPESDLPCVGQTWKHYKGATYRIALLGTDEFTHEPMVAYQSLEDGQIWFRTVTDFVAIVPVRVASLSDFRANVEIPTVPRFTRVEGE